MFVQKNKKKVDPGFFFDYHIDEDKGLKNLFWHTIWVEETTTFFSEFLLFNITRKTNMYSMVFVPFIGLNHYR